MDLPAIDALWDYDNPQATALKFREFLATAEKSVDKTYYAELLTQLARTQSMQRNFDEAHVILDTARQVIEGQNMPVAEIAEIARVTKAYVQEVLKPTTDRKKTKE